MINNIESTVASTRIRLARNLEGYPFPNRLNDAEQAKHPRARERVLALVHRLSVHAADDRLELVAEGRVTGRAAQEAGTAVVFERAAADRAARLSPLLPLRL